MTNIDEKTALLIEEIENSVTPEMEAAGVVTLCENVLDLPKGILAYAVYVAMERVRRGLPQER